MATMRSWPDHPQGQAGAVGNDGVEAPSPRGHGLERRLRGGEARTLRFGADMVHQADVPSSRAMPRAELLAEAGRVDGELLPRGPVEDLEGSVGLARLDMNPGHGRGMN